MSFELIHFRDSDRIIREKNMTDLVTETLQYVDDVLYGSFYRGTFLRSALDDLGWRENGSLPILPERRYQFKGCQNRVAIEGNLYVYEYIFEGLFRLQVGFDQGGIDVGILLLNGQRSDKSKLGNTAELVRSEIQMLYPTVSLPVAVAVFDLGKPRYSDDQDIPKSGTRRDYDQPKQEAVAA